MTEPAELWADVGQHVADVCVRCYQLESILTDFVADLAAGREVEAAAFDALERLRGMGNNLGGDS